MRFPAVELPDWFPWKPTKEARAGDKPAHVPSRRFTVKGGVFQPPPHYKPVTNKIRTAKYTLWNFIFKNLFEQFRRVANFYFILMFLLQLVPEIRAWPAGLGGLPLFMVLGISAFKDAIEDWKRHLADYTVNKSKTRVLRGGEFRETNWDKVAVGDFVKLCSKDQIPADILIISTSNKDMECFVETKNLDGETNLKTKFGHPVFEKIQSEADVAGLNLVVEADAPNVNLYSFGGHLELIQKEDANPKGSDEKIPLLYDNILLRGCFLKNTPWVIGLVLYTGRETKIVMNTSKTPSKRTRIERKMNPQIGFIFIFQVLLAAGLSIAYRVFIEKFPHVAAAFTDTDSVVKGPNFSAFLTFWTFIVVTQNFIPIALYASVEVIKGAQAYLIGQDVEMYYEKYDSKCVPRSWNLSDDLGQVSYLFSDKTGTLTENIMKFKRCTINGHSFGGHEPGRQEVWAETLKILEGSFGENQYADKGFEFLGRSLAEALCHGTDEEKANITDFFTLIALCHAVFLDRSDAAVASGKLLYSAQSPDEVGLVEMAKNFGFVFLDRTPDTVTCQILGEVKKYKLLYEIPFSSDRKRMSVVVETPDGELLLLTKGADNVINERAKRTPENEQRIFATFAHLQRYAEEGLRTLCLARKPLDRTFFESWLLSAKAALADSEDRDEKLERAYEEMENDLEILGGTAIEDKLQEQVPETIAMLRSAGIKIWMLTGDKLETAINIAISCNLFSADTQQVIVQGATFDEVDTKITQYLASVEDKQKEELAAKDQDKEPTEYGLVIDGKALLHALHPDISKNFLRLCCVCTSVVCCRVSPQQKADVVGLVRKNLHVVTLAIGDGANDVSMIQRADVGVGIVGLEGKQAVMASDYAIARFKFLQRLLLVHGRWCYIRCAEMTLIFFFKNFVFVMPIIWFQTQCGSSAQMMYHFANQMLFNLLYTSLPVVIAAFLDQQVSAEYSLKYPTLFEMGIRGLRFNRKVFWRYVLDGIWQSVACFMIPFIVYGKAESSTTILGKITYMEQLGAVIAAAVVLSSNLTVALMIRTWNWVIFAFIFLACSTYFLLLAIVDGLAKPTSEFTWDGYGLGFTLFSQGTFWLTLLLTVFVSLLPRFATRAYRTMFHPLPIDVVMEIEARDRKLREDALPGEGTEMLESTMRL